MLETSVSTNSFAFVFAWIISVIKIYGITILLLITLVVKRTTKWSSFALLSRFLSTNKWSTICLSIFSADFIISFCSYVVCPPLSRIFCLVLTSLSTSLLAYDFASFFWLLLVLYRIVHKLLARCHQIPIIFI